MTTISATPTALPAYLRLTTRVVWLLVFGVSLTMFATGIPLRFSHLITPVSEDDPRLIFGLTPTLEAAALMRLNPQESLALQFLFLSPDGRFVPDWTRALVAGFTGAFLAVGTYAIATFIKSGLPISINILFFFVTPAWFIMSVLGVITQVYRYLHISDLIQHQQTKWVAIGLAAIMLGFATNAYFLYASSQSTGLSKGMLNLVRAALVNLCMILLPICLALSVFRYQLWDIDVIIRRTLIYGLLTVVMGVIYLVAIIGLQGIFSFVSGQQSTAALVLSTLAIAALFNPLRRRVQDFIDRRFFRRKYNAEQVLAEFAIAARNETDLAVLKSRLMNIAIGAMQSEQVSLWLTNIDHNEPSIGPAK
jgi:hypothetical protein